MNSIQILVCKHNSRITIRLVICNLQDFNPTIYGGFSEVSVGSMLKKTVSTVFKEHKAK